MMNDEIEKQVTELLNDIEEVIPPGMPILYKKDIISRSEFIKRFGWASEDKE
jgi:hypothetical protein